MLKRDEVKALFLLAGIQVLNIKALPDGYDYNPDDDRYFNHAPRCVWWFVKTPVGWIEIGWRKRVISIDWRDTGVAFTVTADDTTKSDSMVHAWDMEAAQRYLKTLAPKLIPA